MSAGYPSGNPSASTSGSRSLSAAGMFTDESCLPWNFSRRQDTAVSVVTLKIPPKARSEYEKACDANNNNKFEDAEGHARQAIHEFQSYPAAWVMLGMTLEQQHRQQEARDACDQAVMVDPKYLPGFLCQAEFSARSREWAQVLNQANLALGLYSAGNSYAYYYRAAAFFHLKNLPEARNSALKASELDVNRSNGPLYFLLAQIYEAEGNKADAEAELRRILRRPSDRQQEDAARQFLARLESQANAK